MNRNQIYRKMSLSLNEPWTIWPEKEVKGNREYFLTSKGNLKSIIPIYKPANDDLASIEIVKKYWQDSFLAVAWNEVIRCKKGYFIVNVDSKYYYPRVFQPIELQAFCLLP